MIRVLLLTLTILVGLFVGEAVLDKPVMSAVPQDCQYPARPLNPDGTCDNTDPATPEEIKGTVVKPEPQPEEVEVKQCD